MYCADFDLGAVLVVRHVVSNFILHNQKLTINGIPLAQIIPESYRGDLQGYCEDVVLNLGRDAEDLVITVTSLAFRITVNVVFVDARNKDSANLHMETQKYPGSSEDYKLVLPDSLGLHDEGLFLFLKGGHYDLIYQDGLDEELGDDAFMSLVVRAAADGDRIIGTSDKETLTRETEEEEKEKVELLY